MIQTHQTRNVAVLAACQALSMSGSVMVFAVVALAGKTIAPAAELATLPLGVTFVSLMLSTVPASLVMGRLGRRAGFTLGQAIGVLGAGASAWALLSGSFWGFAAAAVPIGVHNAFFQYLRFAAADTATPEFRPRAISYVMAGGVVAGFVGPELARRTAEALPTLYAGAYAALAGLCLLNIIALQLVRIPRPHRAAGHADARPVAEIARQPVFIVAALSAMVGYGVMNLVMVATPLAMAGCGFSFGDSTEVIRAHVLGMFVPAFFTGSLIRRWGVLRVIATGAVLLLACLAINLAGTGFANFWGALVALGVGWNFMFVGGTTLLLEAHRPEDKARTQAMNDLLVFTTTACTSFASGAVQNALGWQAVNALCAVPVVMALAAVLWLRHSRR
jgi:predicted MFS family arabinose efflux permease